MLKHVCATKKVSEIIYTFYISLRLTNYVNLYREKDKYYVQTISVAERMNHYQEEKVRKGIRNLTCQYNIKHDNKSNKMTVFVVYNGFYRLVCNNNTC